MQIARSHGKILLLSLKQLLSFDATNYNVYLLSYLVICTATSYPSYTTWYYGVLYPLILVLIFFYLEGIKVVTTMWIRKRFNQYSRGLQGKGLKNHSKKLEALKCHITILAPFYQSTQLVKATRIANYATNFDQKLIKH